MIPMKKCVAEVLMRRNSFFHITLLKRFLGRPFSVAEQYRGKNNNNDNGNITALFKPVPVKPNPDDINVGLELSGALVKNDIQNILDKFFHLKEIKTLALEYGLDNYLQRQAHESFRQYCLQTPTLPVDLHLILSDILQGAGHITDLFPYFIRHAKQIFPHIDCLDDLKKISDLRTPANWYPNARQKNRKIIFHAGPTNSGKTYHALKRFISATSGVYCGPLKLLAVEVFNKSNENGTPCDLITGEDRRFASNENEPSNHVACTVEMVNVNSSCEVAIIDEIQLMKDFGRGWAWTRALLGVCANEVHVCGEAGALGLVRALCETTGDTLEVHNYERLTELKVERTALITLANVMPGDCIVCFSKNDIYTVSRVIESSGKEVAVIYGSLPPGTKLAQAAKFNDPDNSCKILVATDAIGMGLNLHIRRIIFYSMVKPTLNEKGEREMDTINVSSALQIAGRAGRYGTQWETGYVTTFSPEDLPVLRNLMSQTPEAVKQAGLHPTADQIEMYAYHLPDSPLSNLMDIFVSLCTVDDSLYFMCDMQDFKFLADMIQHVNLPLRARYVFCCAPINRKLPLVCSMFLKYARQYSRNDYISAQWVQQNIGWPLATPMNIQDLINLEAIFDVLDLYLWLSYRFLDLFRDSSSIREMQADLDIMIQNGIVALTKLLRNTEEGIVSKDPVIVDFAQGKVSETLIAQGRLTLNMLEQLHKEWSQKNQSASSSLKEKIKKTRITKTTETTKRKPKKS